MHTYIHTYIHAFKHTYTHTYTHIHSYGGREWWGAAESRYSWFSFDKYEPTYRNFDTFRASDDPEFVAIYLRVSAIKRQLSVTYQTVDELISDVSGNWAFCLLVRVRAGMLGTRASEQSQKPCGLQQSSGVSN